MYKILTLNNISDVGLKRFSDNYEYSSEIKNPNAIMVRSASMHEYDFNNNILAVARAGAGVNNIPIEKCIENGIVVFNTPGANANAVKELVIASLLLSSRKIVDSINWAKTLKNKGKELPKLIEKGKNSFSGPEILGKRLGVIGLGAIGILVANTAKSLGMKVMGYDPFLSVSSAWNLISSVKSATSIDEILSECDYISIHVPLNENTKNMINKEAISKMKDGVRILNFSRGGLVNSPDIIESAKSGKLGAYVTDFPTCDMLNVENIISIPHLGASTPESEDNCAKMAADELVKYLEYGDVVNAVSLPDVSLPVGTCGVRVCVINRNIPNMLNKITGTFAKHNININNMQNKSKGAYAYTLIDSQNDLPSEAYKELCEIDGIIKVRIIKDIPSD
jgi:D-3-phosphoglycerate dehydrogenase